MDQEIEAAIDEDRPGFRKGWISSHFLDKLIKEMNVKISRNKRKDMLHGMGYDRHPGLDKGKMFYAMLPDMVKSTLYIKKGHYSSEYKGAGVSKAYSDDQIEPSANPFLSAVQTK